MRKIHRDQQMDERLQTFLQVIKSDTKKEQRKILQKSEIQQAEARNKIINQDSQFQNQNHLKRLKELDVQAKIYKSSKINQSRMSKMNVRHQLIQNLKTNLKSSLIKVSTDQKIYQPLLQKLIIQGLLKLMQQQVQVKCLKKDLIVVKKVISKAQQQFNTISQQQTTVKIVSKVTLNEKQFLDNEYKEIIGGVVLSSLKGRIVCNNTLDARLSYCMEDMLPHIRHYLFQNPARNIGSQ